MARVRGGAMVIAAALRTRFIALHGDQHSEPDSQHAADDWTEWAVYHPAAPYHGAHATEEQDLFEDCRRFFPARCNELIAQTSRSGGHSPEPIH
jgi:hypothetical protein